MSHTMLRQLFIPVIDLLIGLSFYPHSAAQQSCFSAEERERAEKTAKVYRAPDPGYDPVLGYDPAKGPRRGAPPAGPDGLARSIKCTANKDESPGAGTTPKFHCSVAGVVD